MLFESNSIGDGICRNGNFLLLLLRGLRSAGGEVDVEHVAERKEEVENQIDLKTFMNGPLNTRPYVKKAEDPSRISTSSAKRMVLEGILERLIWLVSRGNALFKKSYNTQHQEEGA